MSVDICDFIGLLKHSRGDFAGKPFVLEQWQIDYLSQLFNTKRPDGLRQYRTSLLALPRKNGKALALDTPVLTTEGWKTMGTVAVGDSVFHPAGHPVRVIAATESMHDRPCYAVSFTGGETIVADEDHLWYTNARIDRPGDGIGNHGTGKAGWRVRSTKQIAASVLCGTRGDRNHSVFVAEALEMPEAELPIDPYILGAWLGDGHSATASITVGLRDSEMIENLVVAGANVSVKKRKTAYNVTLGGRLGKHRVCARGHRVVRGHRCLVCDRAASTARRRGEPVPPSSPPSIRAKLRLAGLLNNKHIPEQYKRASLTQRMRLFNGLMDTDGTISKAGECEFVSTNRRLAEDFAELAASLGLKVSFKEGVAALYGRVIGPKYRIQFTPLQPMRVFWLNRKQERVKKPPEKASPRSRTRQITACERVQSVPVRCIQVDSPDGMFLVGRSLIPTHNSALSAAVGLYMLFCDDIGAEVIVAAGDRSQAALLHTAAKQFVESCPSLSRQCKVYRNSIVLPDRNASMFCISAEAGTKHGYNPSCVLVDEYHVLPDRELVDVLETGMGARSQPLAIYITTAGTNKNGPCYKDWQRAEKIRDGILKDDTFLPCIFAADPEADPFDESTWKAANPNYGITLKPDYFHQMALRAKQSASEEVVFRTLHLNQWCSTASRWIRHGAWEANGDPLRPTEGRPAYCGVDLASTTDTTAFVAVWPDEDGTFDIHGHIFIPEDRAEESAKRDRVPYLQWAKDGFATLTEGDICDYDAVRDYILSFCERNDVRGVAIDRYNATHLTTQLVAEGVDVKPFGQGFVSMSAPSKLLETLIISKRLRHAGNPVLAWQMSNVQVKTDDAGNIKPSKKNASSTARIDAAVALIMALGISAGEARGPDEEPQLLVF